MKAILICPADRAGVTHLAERQPLAILPLLGKSPLVYWLEALVQRGVIHVLVLASDRPNEIRAAVGDGSRWGVKLELLPQKRELTAEEARAKYRPAESADWLANEDAIVIDHLPGLPDFPLFENYAGWFAAVLGSLPHTATTPRIGAREIQPGVWIGLRSRIAASARLHAPCWIGDHVVIGPDTVVGPEAVIEDRVVVEAGARVISSVVAPDTFVGRHVSVTHSLAGGSRLLNWKTASLLEVPDAFLLGPLDQRRVEFSISSWPARMLAVAALCATSPFAIVMMLVALLRGEPPLRLRLGVRPQKNLRPRTTETFGYYELTGAGNWLRRWPQFWSVARGDLVWIGNRPLRPTQAFGLTNDFERLWLSVPPGLVSLADACGCPEGVNPEGCAHASFYAVNQSSRLDASILTRAMLRASMAWPIYWTRRREQTSALPQLLPKQQG